MFSSQRMPCTRGEQAEMERSTAKRIIPSIKVHRDLILLEVLGQKLSNIRGKSNNEDMENTVPYDTLRSTEEASQSPFRNIQQTVHGWWTSKYHAFRIPPIHLEFKLESSERPLMGMFMQAVNKGAAPKSYSVSFKRNSYDEPWEFLMATPGTNLGLPSMYEFPYPVNARFWRLSLLNGSFSARYVALNFVSMVAPLERPLSAPAQGQVPKPTFVSGLSLDPSNPVSTSHFQLNTDQSESHVLIDTLVTRHVRGISVCLDPLNGTADGGSNDIDHATCQYEILAGPSPESGFQVVGTFVGPCAGVFALARPTAARYWMIRLLRLPAGSSTERNQGLVVSLIAARADGKMLHDPFGQVRELSSILVHRKPPKDLARCSVCQDNRADLVFTGCRHRSICSSCIGEVDRCCPICRTRHSEFTHTTRTCHRVEDLSVLCESDRKSEEFLRLQSSSVSVTAECQHCHENAPDMVNLECLHMALCSTCCQNTESRKCPVPDCDCSGPYLRVFF